MTARQFAADSPDQDGTPSPRVEVGEPRHRVTITDGLVIMRRDDAAPEHSSEPVLLLDHPTISHRHARFTVESGKICIADLGSTNGTWVNNERISQRTELKPGDLISVGAFIFRFDGTAIEIRSHAAARMLGAYAVSKQIGGGDRSLFLLRDVTFELPPGQLVCVIGASGSGKSTLMNIISGRKRPTSGKVKLGRFDIHEYFDILKQDMGYVPQRDPLHEYLTLRQALTYSARLRLPPDVTAKTRAQIILDAAESVGLEHRLDLKIAALSGGERKRASLATEILSRPDLLFLDEVTTGLDESTDRDIMRLLKRLVMRGMTIVCVTHTLANIEDVSDEVVVLGKGGVVTFSGTPAQLRAFFSIQKLGEVFEAVDRIGPEAWHQRFEAMSGLRAIARARSHGAAPHAHGKSASLIAGFGDALRQFAILTQRNVTLLFGDVRTLVMAAIQAIAVGALLGFAFSDFGKGFEVGSSKISFLVVLGITCIWIGCAGAAKAIVGELPIYTRERDINLSTPAFVSSKFLVIACFAVCQVIVLVLVSSVLVQSFPAPIWQQFLLASLAAVNGVAIGLTISSIANSRDQAAVIVPLALAPQLIFGSGLMSNLSWYALKVAQFVIGAYWSRQAMTAALISHESGIMKIDPVKGALVPVTAQPLGVSIAALSAQTLAWLAVATLVMYTRFRRRAV